MCLSIIYKKGDRGDLTNCRPIALVNSIVKIFSQILCQRLLRWFGEEDLLSESQSGFKRERSCLDNLFTLTSLMQILLNYPNGVVYTAFMDFKGAFDSVSHDLLWLTLRSATATIKVGNNFTEKV